MQNLLSHQTILKVSKFIFIIFCFKSCLYLHSTIRQVLPGARIVIVRCEGAPAVCRTDEVGEILVHSPATASSYWGLPGLTQSAFKVRTILFCS